MNKKPIAIISVKAPARRLLSSITACTLAFSSLGQGSTTAPIYLKPGQPLEARVQDLVSKLSLEEKVQQMMYNAPAVPQLNIPTYNWSMVNGEVVQLCVTPLESKAEAPLSSLRSLRRITLAPGASPTVRFTLFPDDKAVVNKQGQKVQQAGKVKLSIAGTLPVNRSEELGAIKASEATITIR